MNVGNYLIHQPSGTIWIVRQASSNNLWHEIEMVGNHPPGSRMLRTENWRADNLPDGWSIADLPAVTKAEFDKALNCGKLPTT